MNEEVWSATIMRPYAVRDLLGQGEHIRQCRALGRARSRAEFARKLIAAGLERRPPAAVSNWLRYFGGVARNDRDVTAVNDDRVYLTALDGTSAPYIPYPIEDAR